MKIKKLFLILGVLMLLMLLVLTACSSNESPTVVNKYNVINTNNNNSDSTNNISVHNKDKEQQNKDQQGKEQQNQQQDKSSEELQEKSDSKDAKKLFEDLVSKGQSLEFKVNYKTTTNVQGQTEVIDTTWFLKDKKFRMDNKGDVQGQLYESRMITTENQVIMCNKQDSWICFDLGVSPEQAREQEGHTEIMKPEDIEKDLRITAAPDRQIAGTTAKCFIVNINDASSEFCYSKEGIPLYSKTYVEEEGASFIQEATSYSTIVSNSDFEPPAKVQDIQKS